MMLTTFSKNIIDITRFEKNNKVVNVSNSLYNVQYYKNEAMILNELMGNYLAKYFNLSVPNLNICEDNNQYGLLYSNMDGKPLKLNKMNLYNFINSIYNKYHDIELIKQLLTVVVLDIVMGNPCRYRYTILFKEENDSLKLNSIIGFAFSYLAYNDINHPSIDAIEMNERYGDLYTNVLEDLPKLLIYSPYLKNLLDQILNLDIENIIHLVENYYDIISPSYLTSQILDHEYQTKKLVKEKILGR